MSRTELCRGNMDVIEQINALFPTEQSLSHLDAVMMQIDRECSALDEELAELVQAHGNAGEGGDKALAEVCLLIYERTFTYIQVTWGVVIDMMTLSVVKKFAKLNRV